MWDFNAIRFSFERRGGSTSWPVYMNDLHNYFFYSGLEDLKAYGSTFTWSNNNEASFISRKLDRVVVNDKWMYTFHQT